MFLLDNFVITTEQQTNLKFLVRLGKSSEALCMLQQVNKEQTLSRSTVFFSGTIDSKKYVRMLRMIPGVEGLPTTEIKPMSNL